MRTRLPLLPLCLLLGFVVIGCPVPIELSWLLVNDGVDTVFVQGPDGDTMPFVEVEYDGEFLPLATRSERDCLRACGSIAPAQGCPEIAEVLPEGYAVLPGETFEVFEGRVYLLDSGPAGDCVRSVSNPGATRISVCYSSEALDGAGDPLVFEGDEGGEIPVDSGPVELVDPTCETVEDSTVDLVEETS